MLTLFQYDFMIRAFIAGGIVALIAPVIGTFLVLRRYSLISDTLAHVSLAGIALGLLLGINPLTGAFFTSTVASLAIDKLRSSKRTFSESALAIFLTSSLALALILISLSTGLNSNLFSYLFGSITTVTVSDLWLIIGLGSLILVLIGLFFKELFYIAFDEESARVSGLPVNIINAIFIMLTAATVTIAIPTVGILLISALMVIPVISALQLKLNFGKTLFWAIGFSLFSVIVGIIASFYLNLPSGATIVIVSLIIFLITLITK